MRKSTKESKKHIYDITQMSNFLGLFFRVSRASRSHHLSRVLTVDKVARDYIWLFTCNQYLFSLRASTLSRTLLDIFAVLHCSTCKLNNLVACSAAISADIGTVLYRISGSINWIRQRQGCLITQLCCRGGKKALQFFTHTLRDMHYFQRLSITSFIINDSIVIVTKMNFVISWRRYRYALPSLSNPTRFN